MDFRDDDYFPLFDHGSIIIASHDKTERQVALKICMPCCVIQAILPIISDHGTINNYSVKNPIIVWMPTLAQDRFNPQVLQQCPTIHSIANTHIRKALEDLLAMFADIAKVINSPTDLTPLLPLGTYVIFQFRANVDDIAKILIGLNNVELPGVAEFRFTLAAALARTISLIA